ncbi:MAG TPA: hypothetical protein VGD91_29035 [Trebonia sp.]
MAGLMIAAQLPDLPVVVSVASPLESVATVPFPAEMLSWEQ